MFYFVRLPGPPLTKQSAVEALLSQGVVVGIGCKEIWQARSLSFDIAWVRLPFLSDLAHSHSSFPNSNTRRLRLQQEVKSVRKRLLPSVRQTWSVSWVSSETRICMSSSLLGEGIWVTSTRRSSLSSRLGGGQWNCWKNMFRTLCLQGLPDT